MYVETKHSIGHDLNLTPQMRHKLAPEHPSIHQKSDDRGHGAVSLDSTLLSNDGVLYYS